MNLSYKEIRTYSPMGRWNSRSVADWLCMPLSPFFSTKFVKWQLRPNTITLFMIFFGIVGSLFFALPKWEFKVLGIICYYLWYIMDCSDGEVARITKQFSTYGRDMDYWAHLTCHPLMNLALWYSYWQLDRYHEWLLAFIFIVFISMEFQHRALLTFQAYHRKETGTESVDNPSVLRYIFRQMYQYPNFILLFPFVFLLEYLTEFPTFYLLAGWCLFFVVGVGQALLRMIAFGYSSRRCLLLKERKNKLKNTLSMVLWGVLIFIITRQVPFVSYSILGNLALLGIVALNMRYDATGFYRTFLPILCWCSFLVFYALLQGNEVTLVARFILIIFFLLTAYFIILPSRMVKLLFALTLLQCIFLIGLEFILLLFFNLETYEPLRHYFINQGWGDVYTFTGHFYNIPVKGNALLPFVYMLSYFIPVFPQKRKSFFRCIYLLAIVFAGNFAYLISLFVFHFMLFFLQNESFRQLQLKILALSFLIILFFIPGLIFVENVMSKKVDSMGTRQDQVEVLLRDIGQENTTIWLGKGLGNTVSEKTNYRDYTGNIYFELQTFYFFNQLGIINFISFILLNLFFAYTKIRDPRLLFVYLCYILYAFTNPYILDSNQVIVILTLVMANKILEDENRVCTCNV